MSKTTFGELWLGDRFRREGDANTVWTKVGEGVARRHSTESTGLGARGFGYMGDTCCAFDSNDEVTFEPVASATAPAAPLAQPTVDPLRLVLASLAFAGFTAACVTAALVPFLMGRVAPPETGYYLPDTAPAAACAVSPTLGQAVPAPQPGARHELP